MHKWIIAALLGFIVQGSSMIVALEASQDLEAKDSHKKYASYWLLNQPSLTSGENVLFNQKQTLKGIAYDPTSGIFTLPPGVYAINFFGTPNQSFENTLNLNVNGTIIPTPSLEGSMIVIQLSQDNNEVVVQAIGNWSPQTGDLDSFFYAYSSIAIYQIAKSADYGCLYSTESQTLSTGENVLFANQISLAGIDYDDTTGVFTLDPGTYSVTYFSNPSPNIVLIANGSIVPNSPLGGSSTILNLLNSSNTLSLQAQSNSSLPAASEDASNAMITIYQIK